MNTFCVKQCCGCHGPMNGKQNYCFVKCQPRNGGVFEANVSTWFWVRTSLSKKLWTKCIDYKIEENGTYVWYKLIGDSEIPIEVGFLDNVTMTALGHDQDRKDN